MNSLKGRKLRTELPEVLCKITQNQKSVCESSFLHLNNAIKTGGNSDGKRCGRPSPGCCRTITLPPPCLIVVTHWETLQMFHMINCSFVFISQHQQLLPVFTGPLVVPRSRQVSFSCSELLEMVLLLWLDMEFFSSRLDQTCLCYDH